ncbi:TusE/DsrC/DsvC family sulfur relay protein [Marinicella litoralis]|uniref:Sulfurtransferase n=1 Tax=Marinicella litoralis TaxID=644220 RepID=A0A4R6XYG6_9GAMM|nr:TusE/DsrC/DsvC family sulfur relay protein [Marinicella litoralis]TDR22783.1 tRNA 2-thiouridine synthesizing protein E [Marinicella litoralis]
MKELELDQHGHLINQEQWSEQTAVALARTDGMTLTDDHWLIIHAVREIYSITGETPPMRLLIKALNQSIEFEINSRFLYRLYPDGPVRYASKHAGLPKPKHCM